MHSLSHAASDGADELALIRAAQSGSSQAMEALLRRYHALVAQIALRALPRLRDPAIELPDLLQAGRLGLLTAIRKYDAARGCCLTTIAVWWIRHAVGQVVDWSGAVRVPTCARAAGNMPPIVLSLDYETTESGDPLHELLAGPDDVENEVVGRLPEEVQTALAALPPVLQRVLILRFGLRDGEERTLAQVAALVGVTKEAARQRELRGLAAVRQLLGAA